jgi:hypothetical protein
LEPGLEPQACSVRVRDIHSGVGISHAFMNSWLWNYNGCRELVSRQWVVDSKSLHHIFEGSRVVDESWLFMDEHLGE